MENRINSDKSPVIAVLGSFDGVHRGHTALFAEARRLRNDGRGKILAYTFRGLDKGVRRLTDDAVREELLLCAGADAVVKEEFARVREFSPERFVTRILKTELGATDCVCGFNYRFGFGGTGDSGLLSALCGKNGLLCHVLPPVKDGGEPVSSTRIRISLEAGGIERANAMLGYAFFYRLPVLHGKKLGRTIGIPTVNQMIPEGIVRLKNGVYATYCEIGGASYPAVTNIGFRPTVNSDRTDLTCETHIIGFSGDLYGKTVDVHFLRFLREETRFDSLAELQTAIRHNIAESGEMFRRRSGL